MTRKNNGMPNGKITRRDSRMTTPPEIPQWLLAAFDVVLTIEEIGQDNGEKEIGELIGEFLGQEIGQDTEEEETP